MHLYKTIGYVTLSRAHANLRGGRLMVAHSISHELLGKNAPSDQDMVVLWDDLGASPGTVIAVSDGAEAAAAFKPELKPVDAYNAAIIDTFQIDPATLDKLK
jgi:microcompartment protein CcmK/EutM